MKFKETEYDAEFDGPLNVKLTAGHFALVNAKYMFGQHRLQLWYYGSHGGRPNTYPDILGPEVDTYKTARAHLYLEKIQKALKGVSGRAPYKIVQLVWAAIAAESGWDGEDSRFRMDNLDKDDPLARGPYDRTAERILQSTRQLRLSYLSAIAEDAVEMAQKFTDKRMDEAAAEGARLAEERIREGHRQYEELTRKGEDRARELKKLIDKYQTEEKDAKTSAKYSEDAYKMACEREAKAQAALTAKAAELRTLELALKDQAALLQKIQEKVNNAPIWIDAPPIENSTRRVIDLEDD